MRTPSKILRRMAATLAIIIAVAAVAGCAGTVEEDERERYGAMATGLAQDCSARFSLLVTGRDSRSEARDEVRRECEEEAEGRFECRTATFTTCGAIVYGEQNRRIVDDPNAKCTIVAGTGDTTFEAENAAEERCKQNLRIFGSCDVLVSKCTCGRNICF